ncbi:hypothetical protein BM74_16355 [Bacillus thuringiensis]|uniref:Uncharacterized protein n=1 Tax=Bacillus thuringiensis TaxID=1428 RepID=A0A437SIE2_BACTU|nr:hypothetical protein BM74_16355 [Bacillus thuringiensis]
MYEKRRTEEQYAFLYPYAFQEKTKFHFVVWCRDFMCNELYGGIAVLTICEVCFLGDSFYF